MSTAGDMVSREVERIAAPLPAVVYVALRAPGALRVLGTYATAEAAKRRCEEAVATFEHEPIVWSQSEKGQREGVWSSQTYTAPWRSGGSTAHYYVVEQEVNE